MSVPSFPSHFIEETSYVLLDTDSLALPGCYYFPGLCIANLVMDVFMLH